MSTVGVFIGRFQPPHQGHIHSIGIATTLVDHLVILIGSANQCRSIKNPWTYKERALKLQNALVRSGVPLHKVSVYPLNDYPYADSQWILDVRATVTAACQELDTTAIPVVLGHMKEGNDYLRWFPDWGFRDIESNIDINATRIRNSLFIARSPEVPATVQEDYNFYQNELELFKDYPFPETLNFNCADAVLECQGHILLVQRGRAPGRGAWALPGGFKNTEETFLDCAIRELLEETSVKVPEKVLRGSIVKTELFDSPNRSMGIPRNTLAVLIRVAANPNGSLPKAAGCSGVDGADETLTCKWIPLDKLFSEYQLYDDHAAIISKLTGAVPSPAFMTF